MAGSSSTKKRALVIGVSIIGVLVILVLALPFIIDVDHFRPQIEAQLKSSLGRQVMIGRLNLSVLAGGISAEKVIIADDPVFSNDPFVVAKSLDIGLEWWPLISSRAIRIDSLTLQDPQLTLLRSPSGKWNFSTLGATAAKPQLTKSSSSSTAPTNFSIQSLKIANGTITVGRAHSAGKKYAYQNVDLTAKNIAYGSTIPFTLTAKTPPDGKLKVEGSAGPQD